MVKRNRNRIRESRSFVPGRHTSDTDVDRHGTCVASLILRVAPEAELYVAKVAEDSKTLGSSAASHIAEVWIILTETRRLRLIDG